MDFRFVASVQIAKRYVANPFYVYPSSTWDSNTLFYIHGKYVYSTPALEKEREIVKEVTVLRKEKEAVFCYAVQGCVYTGSHNGLENHMHMYIYIYIQAAMTA